MILAGLDGWLFCGMDPDISMAVGSRHILLSTGVCRDAPVANLEPPRPCVCSSTRRPSASIHIGEQVARSISSSSIPPTRAGWKGPGGVIKIPTHRTRWHLGAIATQNYDIWRVAGLVGGSLFVRVLKSF